MSKSISTTWDLTPLLKDESEETIAQEQEEITKANQQFIQKWKDREDYLVEPQVLKEALDEYEVLMRNRCGSGNLGYYYSLRSSLDQNDPDLKAKTKKIDDFGLELVNQLHFFSMRLAKLDETKQRLFLADSDLQPYHYFLQTLFNDAKYLLSEPEEKILNLKADVASANWSRLTAGLIAKTEKEIVNEAGEIKKATFEEIVSLISNKDKKTRDAAALVLNEILLQIDEVAEAEINSVLANKKIDDELRGFTRPDQARHISDDVETEVVDLLVETVSNRNDLSQRFYKLKAQLLGQEKLAYHERNVQIGSINKKYDFTEAIELVSTVFTRLDPEFATIFSQYLQNGQIDVYPKKGKRGGAFCAYWHLELPVYVLLNHTGTLGDVLTVAHEMGHAINDELSRAKQNSLNYGTSTYTAEVASTFMEDFVLDELLHQADDELRLAITMMKLNDDVSSIFRQVACYKFEQELHQKFRQEGYLSKEVIGELFSKHMSQYMGEAVEQSPGSKNWWIYWQHIRQFFYVYSYASGLLISKSLQARVRQNPENITPIKEFLASGISDSPTNLFAKLGFNLKEKSFWETGLLEIEHLLVEAENLAKKLAK